MFVQSPAPFNILSLQGLVKQTVSFVLPETSIHFFLNRKTKIVFPEEEEEEIAHQKQTAEMVWFGKD